MRDMITIPPEALKPIDMQDIRLICGEGKLDPKHVLMAVNAILKVRLGRAIADQESN